MEIEHIKVNPLLPKRKFAEARGISARTIDRYVKQGKIPQGEIIDGHGTRGWRASMVNMTLEQLEQLAKAVQDGPTERGEAA